MFKFRLAGNDAKSSIGSHSEDKLKSVSKNVAFKLYCIIRTLLLK